MRHRPTTVARRAALILVITLASAPLAAQRVRAGWEEPVAGTLLSVVYQERVTPQQITSEGVPFFEDFPMPDPRYGADVYRVVFWTNDYDGRPVRAAASLYIPVSPEPIEAPVLAFGSGTTGVGDHCAPSLENPEIVRFGWYRSNMLAYAGQGMITIFPDYVGFNDPTIPQRYFSKTAEGHLMLDSIRAARHVAASLSTLLRTRALPARESFTAGYSQGGHAALAAADLKDEYAPEIELVGSIGFGSTNSVEALFRDAGYYPPNIIYAYSQMYGSEIIETERILQERWARNLEIDVMTMCVNEFQRYYPFNVQGIYTPEFYEALMERRLGEAFPVLKGVLDENLSGLDGHGVPTMLVQGLDDPIASTPSQREFVARLRDTGVDVTYLELEGVSHRYTRPAGFVQSVEFMRELLSR
ncbi:MAG: lipase family protein [Spirochaetota bacterium]